VDFTLVFVFLHFNLLTISKRLYLFSSNDFMLDQKTLIYSISKIRAKVAVFPQILYNLILNISSPLQMQNNQIPAGPPNKQQITSAEFAAKFKSKREVYTFLAVDAKAYLPAIDTVTIYFLKE
jgi:hypothetical protein